ncbi:MAG: DUF5018 domain-containing protein [Bacteroidota bacterium]
MKNFGCFFVAISIILLCACSDDTSDEQQERRSNANNIIGFEVLGISAKINQQENVISVIVLDDTDLTTITPTIIISESASVSPASGVTQDFSNTLQYTVTAEDGTTQSYAVTINTLTFAFTIESKSYELIRRELDWDEAADFAVQRGGKLAEINDLAENQGVFNNVANNANIVFENLEQELVWLGGNDLENEGVWILDGSNDGQGQQFWQGGRDGMAVDGLFSNWGNIEPDGGTGQNNLALILRNTPLNDAAQWNDLNNINNLYFVIEYD